MFYISIDKEDDLILANNALITAQNTAINASDTYNQNLTSGSGVNGNTTAGGGNNAAAGSSGMISGNNNNNNNTTGVSSSGAAGSGNGGGNNNNSNVNGSSSSSNINAGNSNVGGGNSSSTLLSADDVKVPTRNALKKQSVQVAAEARKKADLEARRKRYVFVRSSICIVSIIWAIIYSYYTVPT